MIRVPYQPQRKADTARGARALMCRLTSGVVHQDWSAFRGRAGLVFHGDFSDPCLTHCSSLLNLGRGFGFGPLFSGISRGANPRFANHSNAADHSVHNLIQPLKSHFNFSNSLDPEASEGARQWDCRIQTMRLPA